MALHEEAYDRWAARQPPGSVARFGRTTGGNRPVIRETVSRLWVRKPGWSRYETTSQDDIQVAVSKGAVWWAYSRDIGMETNEGAPVPERVSSPIQAEPWLLDMLDPVAIIPDLWLESWGQLEYAGRTGIHVQGLPRREPKFDVSSAVLRLGAERYELIVDAERGVLLRSAAYLGEDELAVMEITDIAFDESLPDEVFALRPPPGTKVRIIRRQ